MEPRPFPNAEELLHHNANYAAEFDRSSPLAAPPARKLAVVACMDARVDVIQLLGLDNGDAHIIRNAGGIVTDDVIRSLCVSQRALGTREIILIHHTRCGLEGFDDEHFVKELAAEVGESPPWALGRFDNARDDVRESVRRLGASPFITHTEHIRGFVYDVDTGLLDEVDDRR